MPGCSASCQCPTFAEHARSLRVAAPGRRSLTKTTTDVHDAHTVDVTDHWDDRRDVAVKPETIRVSAEEIGLRARNSK